MYLGPTITSDDLDMHSQRYQATSDVVDLVRLLVSHSVSGTASSVRFRSGQGIRLGGYDGIINCPSRRVSGAEG